MSTMSMAWILAWMGIFASIDVRKASLSSRETLKGNLRRQKREFPVLDVSVVNRSLGQIWRTKYIPKTFCQVRNNLGMPRWKPRSHPLESLKTSMV
ncbi:hypothetical protein B0H14DRAFT_2734311, partial [Mycena olivaceomarginata]